jgi:ABC-type branched-subunit amino acid transport system substrate-binding protein
MAVMQTGHFLGTALAIKHINLRGTVLGRVIDVLTYDPGSDPATNGPPSARYPAAGRRCRSSPAD